jgi:hypothetical protein
MKSKEVKTGCNLADSCKAMAQEGAVLPVMMMM